MHYFFYVTKYIHVIHTLASHLRDKQGNWGQSGVKVLKPAGYAVCDGNMSSSFFLSSSFWQHVIFTYFPTFDSDQTWSQWPLLTHKKWWGQRSWWGHWGQKGHFHQKGIKSYRIPSIDVSLMHMHKLDPLYKSYHIRNSSRVNWGHRGQKVIFTKKASSPTECVALMRDSWICISLTPSTKFITLKIVRGHLGSQGSKVIFTKKCYNSSILYRMTIRLIHMHQR